MLKLSVTVWKGKFERYFGEEGATYVDLEKNLIRTAFKKDEFDDVVKKVLEVLKNNGK